MRCSPLLSVGFIKPLRFLELSWSIYPRCSMYGIFTYIWVIFVANVGKYSIHGAYGYHKPYSSVYFVAYHDSANIRATACGKVHSMRVCLKISRWKNYRPISLSSMKPKLFKVIQNDHATPSAHLATLDVSSTSSDCVTRGGCRLFLVYSRNFRRSFSGSFDLSSKWMIISLSTFMHVREIKNKLPSEIWNRLLTTSYCLGKFRSFRDQKSILLFGGWFPAFFYNRSIDIPNMWMMTTMWGSPRLLSWFTNKWHYGVWYLRNACIHGLKKKHKPVNITARLRNMSPICGMFPIPMVSLAWFKELRRLERAASLGIPEWSGAFSRMDSMVDIHRYEDIWGFPWPWGNPNSWMVEQVENPIEMDNLGVPLNRWMVV